ncbi:ROK family protein [Rubritalea marina]|uniref:ROK family protein n=1 Tax=Rubritalea marina TaxID=361055 RepID=UPI000370B964|nr:ROK family protein [Rubritalea marina]
MRAGIELGGTKVVVAIAAADGSVQEQYRFATTTPDETLEAAGAWLNERGVVTQLGVAAFGPIEVNPRSVDYGKVLNSPKSAWIGCNVVEVLRAHLPQAHVVLDTDVNAAVLAEAKSGAARGYENVSYITVGTGIGAGFLVDGRLSHGALHSEFGHLKTPRHPEDSYAGACPFHGDCLEGMASGTAIALRWGCAAQELDPGHRAWDWEAWYLAHGILAMLAITSPSVVVLGGGVSQVEGLHAAVERRLRELAAGYFPVLDGSEQFVVPPCFAQDAGIRGAFLLAESC